METIKINKNMLFSEITSFIKQGALFELHGFNGYLMTDNLTVASQIHKLNSLANDRRWKDELIKDEKYGY